MTEFRENEGGRLLPASATGWSGAASATGENSAAIVTGYGGRAKAGKFSCIALSYFDHKRNRQEMRCALVGNPRSKQKLKADTWYVLDADGNFVEEK